MARWLQCKFFLPKHLIKSYFYWITKIWLRAKKNQFSVKSLRTRQNHQIGLAYATQNEPGFFFQKIALDLIGLHHGDAPFHALADGDEAGIFRREFADLLLVGHFRVKASLAIQPMPNEIGS